MPVRLCNLCVKIGALLQTRETFFRLFAEVLMTAEATARTKIAYLGTLILNTPMWVLFNMLPYILYKDLHASALQIALMTALKPSVSLLSLYWSSAVDKRRDRLRGNIIWARILSLLPFFFFPFVENIWFFIAAFGLYMMLARAVMPAWMEILKLNDCQQSFITGSWIGRIGDIAAPLLIGWVLDSYTHAWHWLFPILALLSLTAVAVQWRISLPEKALDITGEEALQSQETEQQHQQPAINPLTTPWKNIWQLLKERPDFLSFQLGFMLAGTGTMISHPILPQFFVDILQLSYTEMAMALTLCKAVGFLATLPLWGRYIKTADIFLYAAWPPLCICCFTLLLLMAPWHIAYLFAAYLCYGFMQAGGEISWHLSGPIFSKDRDSSLFSSINVLTVGLRGCVVVPLGSLLGYYLGPYFVIVLGGCLCLAASLQFLYGSNLHLKEQKA